MAQMLRVLARNATNGSVGWNWCAATTGASERRPYLCDAELTIADVSAVALAEEEGRIFPVTR